jgi:hypothetical protein
MFSWKKLHIGRETPANPILEGVFDGAILSGEFWLKSLAQRLKHDEDAYLRDLCRAKTEYVALETIGGKHIPVETIRILNPESLLFDLWAWRDCCKSHEKQGFPLVWIDDGWGRSGFELRLDHKRKRSSRTSDALKSLNDQPALQGPKPSFVRDRGWSVRYTGMNSETARKVRFSLKRGLFPKNAMIKYVDIPWDRSVDCNKAQWKETSISIEPAIYDSEVEFDAVLPKKAVPDKHYRWAQAEYSESVDIYKTWAGDEIADILYSVLRSDAKMRMPIGFLEEHVYRQPGLVSVWTREGLVVAVQKGHETAPKIAGNLRAALCDIAQMEGLLEVLSSDSQADPSPSPVHREPIGMRIHKFLKAIIHRSRPNDYQSDQNTPSEMNNTLQEPVDKLIGLHLMLRRHAAHPDWRPIREFLVRLHQQDVYDALRQNEANTHQQEAQVHQLQILSAMHIASNKMDNLEIAIFAYYMLAVAHTVGEVLFPAGIWLPSAILLSLLGLYFAWRMVRPTGKKLPRTDSGNHSPVLFFAGVPEMYEKSRAWRVFALFILICLFGLWVSFRLPLPTWITSRLRTEQCTSARQHPKGPPQQSEPDKSATTPAASSKTSPGASKQATAKEGSSRARAWQPTSTSSAQRTVGESPSRSKQ